MAPCCYQTPDRSTEERYAYSANFCNCAKFVSETDIQTDRMITTTAESDYRPVSSFRQKYLLNLLLLFKIIYTILYYTLFKRKTFKIKTQHYFPQSTTIARKNMLFVCVRIAKCNGTKVKIFSKQC
jgi:hypothetical protein